MRIIEHHIPVLLDGTEITMSVDSRILGLLVHNNERIHLVVLDSEKDEKHTRLFKVLKTDWVIEADSVYDLDWNFIGSVYCFGGWHVFEDCSKRARSTENL